jgi:hypothetical protein
MHNEHETRMPNKHVTCHLCQSMIPGCQKNKWPAITVINISAYALRYNRGGHSGPSCPSCYLLVFKPNN